MPDRPAASLTPATRGSVGVILGASGDTACLAAMRLPLRMAATRPPPNRGAYTRNAQKREFYLPGWLGAAAGGLAGAAGCGSGLPPSMLNFSILAPARNWSRCAVT